MNELQPLINLLSGKFGWLPAALGYIAAIRIPLKFISARIQQTLTSRIADAAASQDESDDRDFDALLSARWYRISRFILDLVFSFKLPTHADFVRLLEQKKNPIS